MHQTQMKGVFYAEKHDRPHPGQLRRLRGLPRHGAHRRGAVLPADLLVRRAEPPRGRPQPLRAGGGEGEGAGLLAGPDLPDGALAGRRQERAGSGGPGGVPEPHRRGLRRLPGKGRRGPGALPGPPPRRALQLHPRLPRERPHPERELAGGWAAAHGRGVASGCRRRHRQGHLAGPAHCLCHGGPDFRLLPPAAGEDRQRPPFFRRGRPRQGAQSTPDGGRGRHEPGDGGHQRRLFCPHRQPALHPGHQLCKVRGEGRARPRHHRPAAELSACGGGDGQPQPDAQRPAAPQSPLRQARLRGPHLDAHQQARQRLGSRPSGRQLRHLGHRPQRPHDGPRQEQRKALPQPREEQLLRPGPDGPAPHRAGAGGGREDSRGRL